MRYPRGDLPFLQGVCQSGTLPGQQLGHRARLVTEVPCVERHRRTLRCRSSVRGPRRRSARSVSAQRGRPRRPGIAPRRRTAATRAGRRGRRRGSRAGWTRTPRRSARCAGLGYDERGRVHPARHEHQPLRRAGDDPVVRRERRDRHDLGMHERGRPASPATEVASSVCASVCSRSAASPTPAGPAARRRPRPCRPARAAARTPAAATGPSTGTRASSSVLTRTAACGHLVAARPARTSSSEDAEPSSTALACAPRSSDSVVCSGRGASQPAVAQHRVDAVAGGGERRRHPFQLGQPAQRIAGSRRRAGTAAKAIG